MPPAWPQEVREAAWAMRCDGMMPTAITRAINAGCDELNGIAYDVKVATVVSWLDRFYKERGKPESNIPVGTELDVANAELRTILTWAKTKRKEIMARGGKLDAEVAAMTKVTALIAGAEKAIRESRTSKDPSHVERGKVTKRPDRSILSKIAKEEQKRRAVGLGLRTSDAAGGDASPGDTSPEPPPPDRRGPSEAQPPGAETNPYGTSGVGFPD